MPNLDPSTMDLGDIHNIAENADNLIKIITNIKQKVQGSSNEEEKTSPGPNDEKRMNSDIDIDCADKPDRVGREEGQIDEKDQESDPSDEVNGSETRRISEEDSPVKKEVKMITVVDPDLVEDSA